MHCISFEKLLTLLKVFCYGLKFFGFLFQEFKKKFLLTVLLTMKLLGQMARFWVWKDIFLKRLTKNQSKRKDKLNWK